jgi:TRAP-type C4-dicarboxylate transport system substrate-binding protein
MKSRLIPYIAAALLLAVPTAWAAETLSLATWGTSSHPQVKEFTKPFMEAVEKNSNGALNFKYFPDDQMVKQNFVPNAVPAGTVDISLATLDSWAGRIPEVSVTVTPPSRCLIPMPQALPQRKADSRQAHRGVSARLETTRIRVPVDQK